MDKLVCISELSLRKVLNLVVCKIKFSLERESSMFGVYVKIEKFNEQNCSFQSTPGAVT